MEGRLGHHKQCILLTGRAVPRLQFLQIGKNEHVTGGVPGNSLHFRVGAVALIIVLGAALALIPRKSTQAYPSPEEAFRYKNQGEILLVLKGEQSAYVIAQQSGSTYAYDLVARDGDMWRPVTGVSANPAVITSGSAVIRVYQYGKTGDYYLSITDGGGQDVTVADNRGSQFHRIGDTYAVSGGTFSAYTYYAYVPDLDDAYQLTVNGRAVTLP